MNQRMIILLSVASIVGFAVVGTLAYIHDCRRPEQAAQERLVALCQLKKKLITDYFDTITKQIETLSKDAATVTAMSEFKKAYESLAKTANTANLSLQKGSLYLYYQDQFIRKLNFHLKDKMTVDAFIPNTPASIVLQNNYIAQNPYPIGKKANLISAPEAGVYDVVHKKYHPIFYDILKKFSYYDIFLIDIKNGRIYYTVFKEIDFANNLFKPALKESNLTQLITTIPGSNSPKIVDFKFYAPSYAAPAAFIAMPISDQKGEIGILALQIPVDQINALMIDNKNLQIELGKTGEIYLVGNDLMMRSISRSLVADKVSYLKKAEEQIVDPFTISNIREFETTILLQDVKTPAAHAALKGETGVMKTVNYQGTRVLSAYTPLNIHGLHWAIIAEQSLSEICAPLRLQTLIMLLSLLALCIAILAFFIYKKYYNKP